MRRLGPASPGSIGGGRGVTSGVGKGGGVAVGSGVGVGKGVGVGVGVTVAVPTKLSQLLPRGFYMLFLVDNHGVPSKVPAIANHPYRGCWVQVL